MNYNHIPINQVIKDWVEDTGVDSGEVNESLLLRWATDAVRMVDTTELLHQRTCILNVSNHKVELPEDYKLCCQVAANPDYGHGECKQCGDGSKTPYRRTRREQIIQWRQDMLDCEGCELEINLICPRCKDVECTCGDRVVEVDIDRIWQHSHPEIYYKNAMNYMTVHRWGDGNVGSIQNKFRLMKISTSDFFNLKSILGDCPNIDCPECYHTFRIRNNHIEVDFEKGEVLLSYLGKQLDGNGDYMVPDHPDMLDAIFFHLEFKYWWKDYRSTSRQTSRAKYQEARAQREDAFRLFRDAVEIPEFKEFKQYLNDSWVQRLPKWTSDSFGHESRDEHGQYGADILRDPNDPLYQRRYNRHRTRY